MLGVMRYRLFDYATAREAVDRLFQSIGLDANVAEISASLPNVVGLSKPVSDVALNML